MSTTTIGKLGRVDIQLLYVFRAVVESGGISSAEFELNICRSTISRHIKDLEMRLGLTLCHRGRKGFSLTPEGKIVYPATLRLLAALDEFRTEASEAKSKLSGSLSLAIFDKVATNSNCQISKAIRLFAEEAPEIELNIYTEPRPEIEAGLLDSRFHIGIVPAYQQSDMFNYDALFMEENALYCSREHPLYEKNGASLSVEDIQPFDFAGVGYHSTNRDALHQFKLMRTASGFDQEGVLLLILSGLYLGFLPKHYAKPFVETGQLSPVEVKELDYTCQFMALTRCSPKPSRAVITMLNCLKEAHKGVPS